MSPLRLPPTHRLAVIQESRLQAFQQVFSPPIFVSFPGPEEQEELFR